MGNLMEAVLAIMGLVSGFYMLTFLLDKPGPSRMQNEIVTPDRSHTIPPTPERLAA